MQKIQKLYCITIQGRNSRGCDKKDDKTFVTANIQRKNSRSRTRFFVVVLDFS